MRRVVFNVRFLSLVVFAMLAGVWPIAAQAANAPGAPSLGAAASFAVLAGSTVTNTGLTKITGDLGVSPGTAVTGFNPPGTVTGGSIRTGAAASQAHTDLITAYNQAAHGTSHTVLDGQNLGGMNLLPGVYTFSSSAQLTGTLTLNGGGIYIFQIGSTLTTASNSVVLGAHPCNIFWQVGSSATIGTSTAFVGTIMALASITVTTGATLNGRALAITGAVTLDTNRITRPSGCGNPVGCNQGAGNDEDEDAQQSNDVDENAEQSNDTADRNESVTGDTDSASDRSEGCDSDNSDKDNSDKDNSDKHNSDKDNSDKDNSDKHNSDKHKSD